MLADEADFVAGEARRFGDQGQQNGPSQLFVVDIRRPGAEHLDHRHIAQDQRKAEAAIEVFFRGFGWMLAHGMNVMA